MNLASNLISGTNSNVVPNVTPKSNTLYNPDIPVKSDVNNDSIRKQRQIKLKDRYYADNLLTSQVKNNGTMSLGDSTSKFSKFGDIDRSIDVNNLRRRNVENNKYTMPDDFFNGSYSAYYSVPRTTRTPINRNSSMSQPLDPISNMNTLNYKNQFSNTSNPIPITTRTKPNYQRMSKDADFDYDKWLYNHKDDIDDTNYNEDLGDGGLTEYDIDKINIDRQKTRLDKNYGKDRYGKPIIRAGTKTGIPRRAKKSSIIEGIV